MAHFKHLILFVFFLLFFMLGAGGVISATADDNLNGTVVETMNSAGYTYVQIENKEGMQWVAIPQALVRVGDKITFHSGMQMGSYTSPTLGRTFSKILFSSGIVNLQRPLGGKGDIGIEVDKKIELVMATGPGAYRIADLFSEKKTLSGKNIAVRGKIFKVSKFQGKNWLRIKDGTGSRKRGNHQIVAISDQDAQVDEIVTLRGILIADRSYGALTYELLIDQTILERDSK